MRIYNEIKKLCNRRMMILVIIWIILPMFIGLAINLNRVFAYDETGNEVYGYQAIQKDKEYKIQLSREWNDNRIQEILLTYQQIINNADNYDGSGNLTLISPQDKKFIIQNSDVLNLMTRVYSPLNTSDTRNIMNINAQDIQTSDISRNRVANLQVLLNRTQIDEIDVEDMQKPFMYAYTTGWTSLLQDLPSVMIMSLILISIVCSSTYSCEYRYHTHDLLYTTMHGGKKIAKHKIIASLLLTSLIYIAMLLLYSFMIWLLYGMEGFDMPLQMTYQYWLSLYSMNMIEVFGLMFVIGYIASLGTMGICLLLSSLFKKEYIIISMSLLSVLMPHVINVSSTIFSYLPSCLSDVTNIIISFDVITIGNITVKQVSMQVVIVLFIIVCSVFGSYKLSLRRT